MLSISTVSIYSSKWFFIIFFIIKVCLLSIILYNILKNKFNNYRRYTKAIIIVQYVG